MKKNKMMRVASALLIAVLLSTCAISGTFAKYVTTGFADDSARVAKWGVAVVATSDGYFDATYDDEDPEYSGLAVEATEDVIAPGTAKNDLVNLTVSGTPEVAVRVAYTGTLTLENWEDKNGDEYCPLVFTVEGTEYKINGSTITNVAGLIAAVQTAIADCSKDYEPNTNLATETLTNSDAPTVSWSWPYSEDDTNDTYLGNVAAGTVAGKTAADIATISLRIDVTITQIN